MIGAIRLIASEKWSPLADQKRMPETELADFLDRTIRQGEQAVITGPGYLRHFGISGKAAVTAGDLWHHCRHNTTNDFPALAQPFTETWEHLIREGPLARRLLKCLGTEPDHRQMKTVYERLADCLENNRIFTA